MTSAMRPVAINTAATCYEIRTQTGFSKLMYPCQLAKPSQVTTLLVFRPFHKILPSLWLVVFFLIGEEAWVKELQNLKI